MSSAAPRSNRRISVSPYRAPAMGVVVPSRDPLDRVLSMGRTATRGILLGILFALIAHGTAAARAALISIELIQWNAKVGGRIKERLWSSYDIDVIRQQPPKVEETKPEPEEPKPQPLAPPPPKAADNKEPEPPPAAAAQAGKALAMDPDPNEPLDMTNTIVQGAGSTYAGGFTAPAGTSTTAVRDPNAKPGGTPGGTGTGPVVQPGPDRTRPAGLLGSTEWSDCPFPQEADAEQIDEAQVTIQVHVKPDGRAEKVVVLSDPGHGFGREARLCAMRKSFQIALDRDGTAVGGVTKPFRVRFTR